MDRNSELVILFSNLFNGRKDVYGSWEGGCVKKEVQPVMYTKHLWGQENIGIYPLLENSTVHWGCSDIDVNDINQALNIQLALQLKKIKSWVEQTAKGFHVWVFAEEAVDAKIMRRALLAAHTAVKVPAKEINPKQEVATGYGNYVRLPYPGVLLEMPERRYMLDSNNNPIPFESFVVEATTNKTSTEMLIPLANLHVPKQAAIFNSDTEAIPLDVAKTLLNPYTFKMFSNGPLEGSDRSGTLVRLAYRLRSDGVTPSMAYSIIRRADIQWGKFYLREDGEEHLSKIIADVYGE